MLDGFPPAIIISDTNGEKRPRVPVCCQSMVKCFRLSGQEEHVKVFQKKKGKHLLTG
jgi:hypothetical protein